MGNTSLANKEDLDTSWEEEEARSVPPIPSMISFFRESDREKLKFVIHENSELNLSGYKNYGLLPLNVIHHIMGFQNLSDLLSMMLVCKLFERSCNNNYFWRSNFINNFSILENEKEVENWKRKFYEYCCEPNDEYYAKKYKRVVKETDNEKKFHYKVTILGPNHTGKSSFLRRLVEDEWSDVERNEEYYIGEIDFFKPGFCFRTINVEYESQIGTTEVISLDFWDKNSDYRDRYRSFDPSLFYRGSSAFLIFFSSDSTMESFLKTTSWVKEIKRQIYDERCMVIILVRSKIDLFKGKWDDNFIGREDVELYVESHDLLFEEVSSKENTNVNKVFGMLLDELIRKKNEDHE